jgi:DNA primase
MFPIHDVRGRITGFGARALDDSLPKYINSPQTPIFDKSSSLYGINLATEAIRQQNLAVIVEGYMDVITAHQNGFNNVVASMGTSVTEEQVYILKKLARNIVLVLDADAAGKEAMLRCVGYENILDAELKVSILPREKDPDDVIREDVKSWQQLVKEASLPVVDYTFNMITAGLDLNAAKDKTLAAASLIPIIAEMKDTVRRAHYLRKLASLTDIDERSLEPELRFALRRVELRLSQERRQAKKPKPQALPTLLSSPVEEYCLALLLQHPELKNRQEGLLPKYFENSENREIFIAWQQSDKIELVKEKLEPAIHEHLDSLVTRNLLSTNLEQKYAECALRLREKFLRSLATKIEAVLTVEAQSGDKTAELTKLREQGIEVNIQLGEVLAQKSQSRLEQRGMRK